jgi:hypothetical protein
MTTARDYFLSDTYLSNSFRPAVLSFLRPLACLADLSGSQSSLSGLDR